MICISAVRRNFRYTCGAEPPAVQIKQWDRPCSAELPVTGQGQQKASQPDTQKKKEGWGEKGGETGTTTQGMAENSSLSAHALQVRQGLF